MNTPCEIVAQSVLPAIRAAIAKELINEHDLTQKKAAAYLDLTQPAVSHYLREFRGKTTIVDKSKELKKKVAKIASEVEAGKTSKFESMKYFCEICKYCRNTALICKFHTGKISRSECDICLRKMPCD